MRGGVVLCGGRSARMGRPKALLPWRGTTMVVHVVRILREVVDEIVVVTSEGLVLPKEELVGLGARIVADRVPDLGPLGGIREGLAQVRSESAYVTSTDAPFLTAEFVERLFSFGGCAAPEVDGFVQSLAAVYPRALAAVASDLIAAGRMRPLFLLEAGNYRKVDVRELPDLAPLAGFNTPEEYLEALAAMGDRTPVRVELAGRARDRAGVAELEVQFGTLRGILDALERRLPRLAPLALGAAGGDYSYLLNGVHPVGDAGIPIGPGECVTIAGASPDDS